MSADCLFCKIANGEIPAKLVHEDDMAVAFEDIKPVAPVHVLVIPRKHIPTIDDIAPEDSQAVGHLFQVAKKIAKERGLAENGYRLVFNCKADAGQLVYHIHLHLLGGRKFSWPPG